MPGIKIRERNVGMFSMFNDVLYALWEFEHGYLSALTVDFGRRGLYFDSAHGPNWWTYYCEPIVLGAVQEGVVEREYGFNKHYAPWSALKENVPRHEAHALASKYIRPKKRILEKVNQFCKQYFSQHNVIGVHYRGTDKAGEAPRVSYETASQTIQNVLQQRGTPQKPCRIFIATDEQAFIDYARSLWGDSVCYRNTIRSTNEQKAIHYNDGRSPYQLGEEAIIDMLLLSKSDIIIRTSSNLSLWSTYFNLTVPVIELSHRYGLVSP